MILSAEILESLKIVREQNGWSQEDLARELGVCFATINRWENGKTKPSKMAQTQIHNLLTSLQKRGAK